MALSQRLTGLCVLVLEDDYYLADDATAALEEAGALVLGPFNAAPPAIEAAKSGGVDCAVVDINLGEGVSFTPAQDLLAIGVAIIFVTGYDQSVVPPSLAKIPFLNKPVHPGKIVEAVAHACGRAGA